MNVSISPALLSGLPTVRQGYICPLSPWRPPDVPPSVVLSLGPGLSWDLTLGCLSVGALVLGNTQICRARILGTEPSRKARKGLEGSAMAFSFFSLQGSVLVGKGLVA